MCEVKTGAGREGVEFALLNLNKQKNECSSVGATEKLLFEEIREYADDADDALNSILNQF
jgi:hypothetical protein